MTKEEYLRKLETLLQENNVEDSEAILSKCESRFNLAKDAGLTLDETIEMLGSPEEIVSKQVKTHKKDETDRKVYNLEVRGCVEEDIIVTRNNSDKIIINIDEELQPYTKINQIDNNISVVINHAHEIDYMDSTIEILVGNNIVFDKLCLASVSGDINLDGEFEVKYPSFNNVSGDILIDKISGDTFTMQCVSGDIDIDQIDADTININTVNGDIKIDQINAKNVNASAVAGDIILGSLKAKECKISTTAGDARVRYIECDYATLNTFSGDFKLTGKIKEKKARSFSGEINYCEVK